MTRTSRTWATAVAAVMALTVTLGLTGFDQADARPVFAKYDGVDGSSGKRGDGSKVDNPADMHAKGSVCCAQRRTGKLALMKPAECRAGRGLVVLIAKCAQAKRVPGKRTPPTVTLKRG